MLKKCFGYEEDVVNYEFPNEPASKLGKVPYIAIGEVIFFQLQTKLTYGTSRDKAKDFKKIEFDEEFLSNIDVRIEQVSVDFDHKNEDDENETELKHEIFEVRKCTKEDFN